MFDVDIASISIAGILILSSERLQLFLRVLVVNSVWCSERGDTRADTLYMAACSEVVIEDV